MLRTVTLQFSLVFFCIFRMLLDITCGRRGVVCRKCGVVLEIIIIPITKVSACSLCWVASLGLHKTSNPGGFVLCWSSLPLVRIVCRLLDDGAWRRSLLPLIRTGLIYIHVNAATACKADHAGLMHGQVATKLDLVRSNVREHSRPICRGYGQRGKL